MEEKNASILIPCISSYFCINMFLKENFTNLPILLIFWISFLISLSIFNRVKNFKNISFRLEVSSCNQPLKQYHSPQTAPCFWRFRFNYNLPSSSSFFLHQVLRYLTSSLSKICQIYPSLIF